LDFEIDWRKYKTTLKKRLFNPKKKRSYLYKLCPHDVDQDQWDNLIRYWKSAEGKVGISHECFILLSFLIDNSQYITNLLLLQALSEKNKISCEMKKIPHTAGTKSYARWSEDLVSPFSRSIDFSSISFLPLLYFHYFLETGRSRKKKNNYIELRFT